MNVETNEEHNSEVAGLLSTEAADMRMVMRKSIKYYRLMIMIVMTERSFD